MPDTKDTKNADEATPYVWISADHVQNMSDLHQVMVAVHPDSGMVLDPQPEYPKDPPPDPPPPETHSAKKGDKD